MPENTTSFNTELLTGAMIVRAGVKDTDKVWRLIDEDSQWLLSTERLDHWSSYYTREIIAHKIQSQKVYLVSQDSTPVATITLGTNPVDYYTPDNLNCFTSPDASAMYVSSLAVKPSFQHRGIATKLMEFAENQAKSRGIKYLRLDCRAEYQKLVEFYKKGGFAQVGSFSEGDNQNYLLMEKVIE